MYKWKSNKQKEREKVNVRWVVIYLLIQIKNFKPMDICDIGIVIILAREFVAIEL